MAGESNLDTNLENYSDNELLTLFDITSHDNYDTIMKKTNDYIDNFPVNDENDEKVKEFLVKAQEKIREKYESTDRSVNGKIHDKFAPLETRFRQNYSNVNTLIVHSKFRGNVSNGQFLEPSTNFSVDLINSFNNVISLKVASLEFQNCFFNISKNYENNTFEIETYKRNLSTNEVVDVNRKPISIPYGSYNVVSFDNFITDFLNNDSALSMIELNFDDLKGIINFRIKSSPPIPPGSGFQWEFNIYFNKDVKPRFLNIGWLLGFSKLEYLFTEDYVITADESLNVGFNGDRCLDMTGTKFFLLVVNDFNKNGPQVLRYITNDETSFSDNNIMAKIPNTSLINEIIFEDSSDRIFKARRYFGPINLQKLQISILDEYGNVLDNNNGDVIVTFEIETLDSPYKNPVH